MQNYFLKRLYLRFALAVCVSIFLSHHQRALRLEHLQNYELLNERAGPLTSMSLAVCALHASDQTFMTYAFGYIALSATHGPCPLPFVWEPIVPAQNDLLSQGSPQISGSQLLSRAPLQRSPHISITERREWHRCLHRFLPQQPTQPMKVRVRSWLTPSKALGSL